MNITAKTNICIIIGNPVKHSISPQMHNSTYKALGIDNEFVYVAAHVLEDNLKNAIEGVKALNVRGVTITIPHKIAVMKLLDTIDDNAEKIGAVNTIVNTNGKLTGYNTDWIGIAEPLKAATQPKGKKVAILGAGGAARAAIFACKSLGCSVVVLNRTPESAQAIAKEFDCAYGSISDIDIIKTADILINTTSVGLESDATPIDAEALNEKHTVFDVVYKPYETKLLMHAKEKGATVIHGTEMLLHQGLAQFELFTGKKAPEDIMRKAIIENL